MKLYRRHLKYILLALVALFSTALQAQNEQPDSLLKQMDSVTISLLTCSPGQEIWSLYGHTAIRYQDKAHDTDLAINYGMFSFNQKNFIIRFVFGRCDYKMDVEPMGMFLMEYAQDGRGVVQQTLNLSREEKMAITQALAANIQPENRTYRYNFFYDNCTTRARDIIVNHLSGKVDYAVNPDVTSSYREMVHQWNEDHPWMSAGCDLLLGVGSDSKTDFAQQQFLPDTLRKDFDKAMVVDATGHKHKLVTSETDILKINDANVKTYKGIWNYITPTILSWILVAFTIFIIYLETRRKKVFWLFDVVMLTLYGLAGIVLFAMIFSYHPTVRVNFQIFLLNPLALFFAYSIGSSITKGRFSKLWNVLAVFLILFIIGNFFQDYASGVNNLALILLLRYGVNRRIYLNPKKKDK